ncbi:hypothetical protein EV426DRAFT_706535 [Tirmania nivea]|nr:hypothetical protein EV426DRAFT_706535 [Tirmania nivea]
MPHLGANIKSKRRHRAYRIAKGKAGWELVRRLTRLPPKAKKQIVWAVAPDPDLWGRASRRALGGNGKAQRGVQQVDMPAPSYMIFVPLTPLSSRTSSTLELIPSWPSLGIHPSTLSASTPTLAFTRNLSYANASGIRNSHTTTTACRTRERGRERHGCGPRCPQMVIHRGKMAQKMFIGAAEQLMKGLAIWLGDTRDRDGTASAAVRPARILLDALSGAGTAGYSISKLRESYSRRKKRGLH